MQRPGGGNESAVLEEQKQAEVLEWRKRRKGSRRPGEVVTGARSEQRVAWQVFVGSMSHSKMASMDPGCEAKRGDDDIEFVKYFLLMSLLVGDTAEEDDLDLHGASPACSREGLQASSPGQTWLISTNEISKLLSGVS